MPMSAVTVADGGMGKWADATAEVTEGDGQMMTARLLPTMVINDADLGDPTNRHKCMGGLSWTDVETGMDPTGMTRWTGAAPTTVGCGADLATERLLTHYL